MKSITKRAYFSKGSARAVEEYKAEVASMTSGESQPVSLGATLDRGCREV